MNTKQTNTMKTVLGTMLLGLGLLTNSLLADPTIERVQYRGSGDVAITMAVDVYSFLFASYDGGSTWQYLAPFNPDTKLQRYVDVDAVLKTNGLEPLYAIYKD